MPKRPHWRMIKTHRSYTVDEAARALGVAKGTVRRWLKSRNLAAIEGLRPALILGSELARFLYNRRKPKRSCALQECYCLTCKAPREPAGGMADIIPHTNGGGNLRALCAVCSGIMHKRISGTAIPALRATLDVAIQQASSRIGK